MDYLTPFQDLQSELVKIGGPSLFTVDRTHASPIGQRIMARLFLRAQGLPVEIPSAELLADGWKEAPLSPALTVTKDVAARQAASTPDAIIFQALIFIPSSLRHSRVCVCISRNGLV